MKIDKANGRVWQEMRYCKPEKDDVIEFKTDEEKTLSGVYKGNYVDKHDGGRIGTSHIGYWSYIQGSRKAQMMKEMVMLDYAERMIELLKILEAHVNMARRIDSIDGIMPAKYVTITNSQDQEIVQLDIDVDCVNMSFLEAYRDRHFAGIEDLISEIKSIGEEDKVLFKDSEEIDFEPF